VVEAAGVHARDVKGGTSCWFACLTHTVDGARALEGRSRTESFVCRSQRGNRDRQADEQTKLFGFFFFQQVQERAVVQVVFWQKLWPPRA